jgi:ubiquinone/menaquinone biosynthesis C-methylase UbiE
MYDNELAEYYDDFYSAKDYQKESEFIEKISPSAPRILDVGCGTGSHIKYLSKETNFIQGVDVSTLMIKKALKKFKNVKNVNFFNGPIENFAAQNDSKFDLAISLFNVVNHIMRLRELDDFFKSVSASLNKGAHFVFDCFNFSAVMREKPRHYLKKIKSTQYPNQSYEIESTPTFDYRSETSMLKLDNKVTIKNDTGTKSFAYTLDHVIWSDNNFKELIDKYFKNEYKVLKANGDPNPSDSDYKIKFICTK